MKAFQSIFAIIIAFMLSSCMAIPDIHLYTEGTQMNLTQSAPISRGADISPDGKYMLTGGLKGGFFYWDIYRGAMINKYHAKLAEIMGTYQSTGMIPVAFASNGEYALSGGKELNLWDLSSGKVIRTIGNDDVASIGVSSDGSKVLTCDESSWSFIEDKMAIYDVQSGRKLKEWEAENMGGIIMLSPDGNHALSTGGGGRKSDREQRGVINLWDATTGELVKTFAGTGGSKDLGAAVLSMAFSLDGKYALSGGTDGSVRLWDISSGVELRTIYGHTGFVGAKAVAFSPDRRSFLSVGGSDGLAKLWDIASGREIRSFRVSDDRFVEIKRLGGIISGWVAFSPDGKRIIYMGSDASFRIFDVATGREIAVLVGFEDGEWLVVTSEGYYNASEKGAQKLNVTFEGKDYTVDQFYDVFYRPDIVAANLKGEDISGLVTITMKDAVKNPPPVVEFTSRISDTDQPRTKVCYQVKSTGGGIGEVRLFHNGKLIQSDGYYREITGHSSDKTGLAAMNSKSIYEDMRSVSIKGKVDAIPTAAKSKGDFLEECKEVEAIPGKNEISISAFNSSNTVQGYMKTIDFNSRVKSEDPHLYILSIGIDQYLDGGVNLKYAVKDAKDLEKKIKAQSATLYKPENIHYSVLTDREATKANITNKIDALAKAIKPQDSFILFAAGHGVLLQNQYYMLTHDFNGEVSEANMISSNEIVEMSKKIKSLSQLFIFDTCHAGGVDSIVSGLYDARMSVLAKKMGLHIYASASDKQSALEGYKGNGLFTYTLLDGLNNNKEADKNKDGKVSIVGLGEYSKKMTTEISKEIGHSQTPLIINFGNDNPIYQIK
ncbi:MAG TPA: caspase family protein [Syntrophales bacterium]|nr:caspase family protein [Syntrophales bacterium]